METKGDTKSWFYLRARAIADGKPDLMPNVQNLWEAVLPEPLNERVEELATERGESVSATTRWIIERHFENPFSCPRGNCELEKEESADDTEKMMKLAKESGLL